MEKQHHHHQQLHQRQLRQPPPPKFLASSSSSSSSSSLAAVPPASSASAAENLYALPSWLGQLGSILFFVTLFAFAHTNADGYIMFRKCHTNCINGLLHALGMPLAVSGVFLVVRAVSDSPTFTRHVQFVVTTAYLALYVPLEQSLQASPYAPWIFYISYMSIFEGILYRHLYQRPHWSRLTFLRTGLALIAFNVGALEVIGHGAYEHHHSYVGEFFNSVFHTPLYGIHSVLKLVALPPAAMEHYTCW